MTLVRTKGSHRFSKKDNKGVTVPNHGKDELKKVAINQIEKATGLKFLK